MDPFSLFLGGIGAVGSLIRGFGGSEVAGINRQILLGNVELSKIQADTAREEAGFAYERGGYEQAKLKRQIDAITGAQSASFAASHLDPLYGSPLLVAARTVIEGETDAELIGVDARMNASRAYARAAGYEAQGASAAGQAYAEGVRGDNAMLAGILGAGTAMLSGVKGFRFGSGTTGSIGAIGSNPFFVNQPTDI